MDILRFLDLAAELETESSRTYEDIASFPTDMPIPSVTPQGSGTIQIRRVIWSGGRHQIWQGYTAKFSVASHPPKVQSEKKSLHFTESPSATKTSPQIMRQREANAHNPVRTFLMVWLFIFLTLSPI